MIGTILGHYRIERELGAGGPAEARGPGFSDWPS
jgi:hypothetical protein